MNIYTVAESKRFTRKREWFGRYRRHHTSESRLAHDAAFTYRMGSGFPGMATRTHPQWIEAALQDSSHPATFYGEAMIADAASPNGVRVPASGDSALVDIYGITVRPFPAQQPTTANNYGGIALGVAAVPPSTGQIDILRAGSMIVTLQGAAAATKGGQVYVCIVAGTGYVVGGFSADTVSGTFITLSLPRYTFNGPADPNGLVEIIKMS